MSNYPDTRDPRRIANSNSKTLLQNWVEERAVNKFDKLPQEYQNGDQPTVRYFKSGHKGLLTIQDDPRMNSITTYDDDYIRRQYNVEQAKGIRYQLTEQMLTQKLLEDMEKEENLANDWSDEPTNYVSETQEKYFKPGFVPTQPAPTAKHDLYSEMPVSYWTEKRTRATGVTQLKTYDTAFKRNAAFSRPIGESWDQPKPHEIENHPYFSQQSNNNAPIY